MQKGTTWPKWFRHTILLAITTVGGYPKVEKFDKIPNGDFFVNSMKSILFELFDLLLDETI